MEGVRCATADDLPALRALRAGAFDELGAVRGGALLFARELGRTPNEPFAAALDDPDALVVVGTLDEVIVGYVLARVESLANGTSLGRAEEVYVEADARAVGVGEAMLDEVLTWCRQRGCGGVDAYALPGSRATKNFFESFGFTARLLVVHRELDR